MKPRYIDCSKAIYFLWPLLTLLLVACRAPVANPAPSTAATTSKPAPLTPRGTHFMTAFGSMEDGYGVVKVSEESIAVISNSTYGDSKSFVSSSIPWNPHPTWFAFVESHRVWFFDGENKLRMHQHVVVSPSNSTSGWYTEQNLPCPIPTQVLDRIPEPFRLKVNSKVNLQ